MNYSRMPIELESPEQLGYDTIRYNLSESSVADRRLGELKLKLDDVLLCYGDHRGAPDLRALVAKTGEGLAADDVLITAGAAGALFIISTSMLKAGDHIVVVRPNYATNIETPRAIGCELSFVDLKFEDGFRLDLGKIEEAIRPNTKYVSVTYPHNPTGVMISPEELRARRDLSSLALVEPLSMHDVTPAPIAEPRIATSHCRLRFQGHAALNGPTQVLEGPLLRCRQDRQAAHV